jgi:hypothetical protein
VAADDIPFGTGSKLLTHPKEYIEAHPGVVVAIMALLLAELRFQTKDADRLPCRYDLNKFKTGDVNWNDVWNVIDDGLIGQQFKPDSVKAGDDGKLVVTALKPAKGVLGYIHSYSNAILNAIGVTGSVYLAGDFIYNKKQSSLYKLLKAKNSEVAAVLIAIWLGNKVATSAANSAKA